MIKSQARVVRWALAALLFSLLVVPAFKEPAHAANSNVTLPASLSIAPNTTNQNLGLGGSVITGLSGTIVVAIKLKNAIYGEVLKQPVTTGLTITDTYGGDITNGFYEVIETGTVPNMNAALNAMTITSPSNVGAPTFWITASSYDSTWKYNSNTHHFYWVGATTESYDAANTEAKAKSYLGFTGYLTTVTSSSENTFVHGLSASSMWLGGTDGSVVANTWKWDPAGGSPEAGTIFYDANASYSGYSNWNSGEPNGGTTENWLQLGTNGSWNDLNNGSTLLLAAVEVGDSGGDIFGAVAGSNVTTMPINASSGSSTIYGLTEQSYFSNGTAAPSLSQPMQQCGTTVYQQPQINYYWGSSGTGSPSSTNLASNAISSYTGDTCYVIDGWITRWTGYVSVPSTAVSVKFQANSDDGESVTVNSGNVLSYWADGQGTKASGVIAGINKNSYYPIDVWFYENGGAAVMYLYWDLGDGNGFVLIPPWALTSTAPATPTMSYSLSTGASAIYRTVSTITETSTVGGKVTFATLGKAIPGCKGVNTRFNSGTYNATCNWKPALHRDTPISVSLVPYGGQYSTAAMSSVVGVIARTGKR